MSKVVKSVGKAVKKVVKGGAKLIKKATSSKVFKALAIAAAVYFTGGAALGAIQGFGATGTLMGTLSGAASGLGAAWGGITGAGSALMSGNFTGIGTALKGGLTAASSAGSAGAGGLANAFSSGLSAAQGAASPSTGVIGSAMSGGATKGGMQLFNTSIPGVTGPAASTLAPVATAAAEASPYAGMAKGMIGSALISSGAQIGGGIMADKAEEDAEEQRQKNMGYRLNQYGVPTFTR